MSEQCNHAGVMSQEDCVHCNPKTPEQTTGERIAAETHITYGWEMRLAVVIDAALAAAREEGRRFARVALDQVDQQLAAKEAEAAAMREALEFIRHEDEYGVAERLVVDNALSSNAGEALLARLSRTEMKLAQREEMLVDEHSVLCVTMNKWITDERKELVAEAAALRTSLKMLLSGVSHLPIDGRIIVGLEVIQDVEQSALSSNAGEALLARLRATEAIKTAAINWLSVCWADLSEREPTMAEDHQAQRQLRDALPADWLAAAGAMKEGS